MLFMVEGVICDPTINPYYSRVSGSNLFTKCTLDRSAKYARMYCHTEASGQRIRLDSRL